LQSHKYRLDAGFSQSGKTIMNSYVVFAMNILSVFHGKNRHQ
jgi:hypothetical protein